MAATTRADLAGLFDDLPDTGAPAAPGRPRPRRSHPVLLLVLIVILAAIIGHALLWIAMPLLFIASLPAAVMFTAGHLRHPAHARTGPASRNARPG